MNLFRRELRESLPGLIGWIVGLAAAVLLYIPFYPSVGGSELMETYVEMFPPEVSSLFGLDMMATGAGYVQATYFGLMGFLLLSIAAIGWGSRSVAGEEESGAMELTLAHGVTRWQVIIEATLALLVRAAVLSAVGSLLILALNGAAQLDLAPLNLLAVSVSLFLLSALAGIAAILGGALSGRRAVATGLGAFIAVAAYVLNAVADMAGVTWLAWLSPYYWAFGHDPITNGFDIPGLMLLLGLLVAMVAVAGWRFDRRDVGT